MQSAFDKSFSEYVSFLEESKNQINKDINQSKALVAEVENSGKTADKSSNQVSSLLTNANNLFNEIGNVNKQGVEIKNAIEAENKNAQNIVSQIQAKLDNINQMASQISAKNETADNAIAKIQERSKAADAFYNEVEGYKLEMQENTKKTKEEFAKLAKNCDDTLKVFQDDTKCIIDDNVKYQEQIKELLAKAVSGSLFRVFSQRQESLAKGTNFWKWAVVVSAALVAFGIILVAWICEAKPDIIFFVRLAIMIPLGFLMFFTAAQYKKERQAEEEYAFKSAISLSIEPYRDLLVKMRKENELEADFVRKLMEDVFDNPVMRLFNIESDEEKSINMMHEMLKKLPKDKAVLAIEEVSKRIFEK